MADINHSRIPADVAQRWQTVRDALAGTVSGYLPTLNAADESRENIARNRAYRERAVYYNATARTMDGLLGIAFRKDPRTQLPKRLERLQKDADGAGNSIYQQSQAAVSNVLACGRHGLYADFTDRPVIKAYAAESIINWRTDGGRLSLVVLAEVHEEEDGYAVKEIPQRRELFMQDGRFMCRIWRQSGDKGAWEAVEQIEPNTQTGRFDFIPFTFVGSRNNDPDIDPAPMFDLATLNIAHYRNSADYEDSVFYCGQAQPWIAGLTEEWRDHLEQQGQAYIGSRTPFLLPESGSMGFAQPGPNTLVKEAMDQKEAQMIALGARLLDQNAVTVTATQNENDRETSTSVLSMCVANVNEAYQAAIRWCALYQGSPLTDDEALSAYKINQDYARLKVDTQAVTALVAAWQAGAMAKPDLRAWLRSEGVIAVERTDEEIDADLEQEGPSIGALEAA